jgi:hypothetical protein
MDDFLKVPRPFYPSLSSQDREIRLLHLQPGEKTEDIECRLRVVSLDTNPSYEALSYRWGDGTSSVLVDGHDILIPQNLEEALCRMRLNGKERVLWADAICIDQSRIAERNEQVALMADIYRKCERCLIWLGNTSEFDDPSEDWSGNLPELLIALSKKEHLDQPDAPRINPMFGFTRIALMLLNAVGWWERIWVVQEVGLAPKSLVMFGSFEMLFSDIANAVEFVNEHDIGSAWNHNSHETDQLCRCMDRIKITFIWADLLELRDHIYRLLEVTRCQTETGSILATSGPGVKRDSPDIVDVLLSVRHRDSTDPRDKVFGVLSLVQDWKCWEPIKADYSKDTLQVFSEFAAQMIQSEYGPKTLLLARGIDNQSPTLPTWAPDWSKKGSGYEHHLITVERMISQAHSGQSVSIVDSTLVLRHSVSKGKIAKLSTAGAPLHKSYGQSPSMEKYERFTQMLDNWRIFVGVENTLNLNGVLNRHFSNKGVDEDTDERIESGSYARLMTDIEQSEDTVDFMPQIQDFLEGILQYKGVLRRMGPDEEMFYRTVIHDTYPLHLRQTQYHMEALCILRLLLIFYITFADPDRFLTRLNSVVLTKMGETLEMVQISRKRLFWTESGKLGIGPQAMIVGDEIFLFEGVETPFVLREVGERLVNGKGYQPCYELVGHCYVDEFGRENADWRTGNEIYLQ